jgi:hypothetical protein
MTRLCFVLSLATLMNVFAPDAHAHSRRHRQHHRLIRSEVGSSSRDMATGWSFAVWKRSAPARKSGVIYYYGSPYLPSL